MLALSPWAWALGPTAAQAQQLPIEPVVPAAAPGQSGAAPDGVLTGTVSDDSAWQNLGIDIPAFATGADVATAASAGSTGALGRAIADVITADLKNNGLFKPTGPAALPTIKAADVPAPDYPLWASRAAQMLVQGSVEVGPEGRLLVGCYLYDVGLKQSMTKATWSFAPGGMAPRRAQMRRYRLCPPVRRKPVLRQPHRLYRRDRAQGLSYEAAGGDGFGWGESSFPHHRPGHGADPALFARLPPHRLPVLFQRQPPHLCL